MNSLKNSDTLELYLNTRNVPRCKHNPSLFEIKSINPVLANNHCCFWKRHSGQT